MISIIVLARDVPELAKDCLTSLLGSVAALGIEERVEYVLADDCSDPASGIVPLFLDFRRQTRSAVKIVRFKAHQHYTHGVAYAMSACRGDIVLFFSHDMVIPPECIKMMLVVAGENAKFGVVRPSSGHMDAAEQVTVAPPVPLRHLKDVSNFASWVAGYHGGSVAHPRRFIGDAMLVRRDVIDKIGVFDTRFFGFMGDIDYGVRVRRAGFDHVVARGAWLHHVGAGHMKRVYAGGAEATEKINAQVMHDVHTAWAVFRQKWSVSLPEKYADMHEDRLAGIEALHRPAEADFNPPLALSDAVCEIL
jgi:GT2 family glycosyltransferase